VPIAADKPRKDEHDQREGTRSFLGPQAGGRVGHLNAQCLCPRQDDNPIPTRDAVRNLSRELFVVHKQEVDFSEVVDDEFFETVGQEMSSLLVAAIANFGHGSLPFEPSTDAIIDTLWLPP